MKDAPINLPEAAEALLLRAKQALTMSTATIGQRDVNAAIVEDIRAYLRAAPSPAEPAAPVCSECNGTGYVMRMTYGRGPDDYEQEIECPKCKGSGEPPAALKHNLAIRTDIDQQLRGR